MKSLFYITACCGLLLASCADSARQVRPFPELAENQLWQSAKGARGRMMVKDSNVLLWRTLWKSKGKEYLVCLTKQDLSSYEAIVYDKAYNVVRRGKVMNPHSDGTPFGLVEVKTASKDIPEKLRGTWSLAVFFGHWKGWKEGSPILLTGFCKKRDGEINRVEPELIQWNDGPTFGYEGHSLEEVKDMVFRSAEGSLSVDAKGNVLSH